MIKLNQFALGFLTTGLVAAYCAVALSDPKLDFPAAEFATATDAEIAVGRLLFYDRILSGNKNIACATCHHPKFATSDGVALAIGEGGVGLGPMRRINAQNRPEQRIPRNAPALFNLGAAQFNSMFHDGRLEADPLRKSGIRTPLDESMVQGFDSVLSAQAMFPVLSGDEMAGHYSENPVSGSVRKGLLAQSGGAWDIIANRVSGIPAYREMFTEIIGPRDIRYTDISNVVADFIAFEWRADNSPFDQYLNDQTMPPDAMAGLELFYGDAGCSACHSGRFQTDHNFHAIAMPQIGPGKAARFETHSRDTGRMRVTGDIDDAYRFRTPSLRNITDTGPYGHDGAYAELESVVRHHLNPVAELHSYDRGQIELPDFPGANDWNILGSPTEIAKIAEANELRPIQLNDQQVDEILAFLSTLRDTDSLYGRLGVPDAVPSGLKLD